MADIAISVLSGNSARQTNGTTSATSDANTLTGHYILAYGSIDNVTTTSTTNPGIAATSGITWQSVGRVNDGNVMNTGCWLGRVTTDGQKTVTINGASGSNLILLMQTLSVPADATIEVDGFTSGTDRTTPFTHASISPAGSQDLLFAYNVVYSGSPTYSGPPSGMTAAVNLSSSSGTTLAQLARQQLSASGATGTRDQPWNSGGTHTGVPGMMFALRASQPDAFEPGRFFIAY